MKYERVEELRKNAKLTQAAVGKMLGISTRGYTHYEKGDRDIPSGILIQLADFYNVTIDYLLGRTDEPN